MASLPPACRAGFFPPGPIYGRWPDSLGAGKAYINFLGNEGQERVKAAYGEAKYGRLAKVKALWDPDNVFRINQNIVPAA